MGDANACGTAYGVYGEAAIVGVGTGNGDTYAGYFNNTATAGANAYGVYVNTATGAANTVPFAIAVSSSEKFRVASNGNVGIGMTAPTYQLQLSTDSAAKPGTSTWTIASDERLKDIRAPFTRGLKELDGLNTIYFNYKKDNPLSLPSDKEFVGIKAQDALKVIPEAVSKDEKGFFHVTNDAIIWTAVNAIKELYHKVLGISERQVVQDREIASIKVEADKANARSAKLEKENAELKARLDRLEKSLNSK